MCVVIVFTQESVAETPYRGFAEANYQDHIWRHDQSVRIQLGLLYHLLYLVQLTNRILFTFRKIVDYVNYATSSEQIAEYVKLFR